MPRALLLHHPVPHPLQLLHHPLPVLRWGRGWAAHDVGELVFGVELVYVERGGYRRFGSRCGFCIDFLNKPATFLRFLTASPAPRGYSVSRPPLHTGGNCFLGLLRVKPGIRTGVCPHNGVGKPQYLADRSGCDAGARPGASIAWDWGVAAARDYGQKWE